MFLSSGARHAGWCIGSIFSAGDSSKRRRGCGRRPAVGRTIRSAVAARDGASHRSSSRALHLAVEVETECALGWENVKRECSVRPAGSRLRHLSSAPSRTSTYPSRATPRDSEVNPLGKSSPGAERERERAHTGISHAIPHGHTNTSPRVSSNPGAPEVAPSDARGRTPDYFHETPGREEIRPVTVASNRTRDENPRRGDSRRTERVRWNMRARAPERSRDQTLGETPAR